MDFIKIQIAALLNALKTKNAYIYTLIVGIAFYMISGVPYLESLGVTTPGFVLSIRPYFLMFSAMFSFEKINLPSNPVPDEEFTVNDK